MQNPVKYGIVRIAHYRSFLKSQSFPREIDSFRTHSPRSEPIAKCRGMRHCIVFAPPK